jgi:hypothetical protein
MPRDERPLRHEDKTIPASVYAPYSFSEVMAKRVVENEHRGNRCEAPRPECLN